jgi:hypothetical protein
MKTLSNISRKIILAGVAILACSGCQLFHKKSSAPAAPATAVGTDQSGAGSQQSFGQPPSNGSQRPQVSSATMHASVSAAQRSRTVRYSSFGNLIDPWQNPMSDAIVWVHNLRQELVSIEIGDRAVGVPDDKGNLVRLILPPGETFGIPDYKERPIGYGAETRIKVIILDDDASTRIAYLLSKPIKWPIHGGEYWGKEISWTVLQGDPVQAAPGPAPTKIPVRIQDIPAVVELTSEGVPAIVAPGAAAPAAPAPASSTSPAPSTTP